MTSSPSGIDCGSACTAAFQQGKKVTLKAKADSGSSFTGWGGACSGTGSCSAVMNSDISVTATFDKKVTQTDYSKLAKSLAKTVSKAKTAEDRYDALLSVMSVLCVGVYTGDGKAVQAGCERGPDDFYLYDFQLDGMANSLGRSEMWTLTDVANPLNSIILEAGGKELDVETLRQVLLSGVKSSVPTRRTLGRWFLCSSAKSAC